MIKDFQFLGASQIACSAQRKVRGSTFPCIDIYDIPKPGWLVPARVSNDPDPCFNLWDSISSLCLVASFQFPRLKFPRIGCGWSQQGCRSESILDFALRAPGVSKDITLPDRVMTFRLEEQVGTDGLEVLQGVISIASVQAIVQRTATKSRRIPIPSKIQEVKKERVPKPTDESPRIPMPLGSQEFRYEQALKPANPKVAHTNGIYPGKYPAQGDYGPVFIEWDQWSSAASIHQSKSSAPHESRGTQVARIARSRLDRGNAVMVIRDYSQQLLCAPSGHMARNLGRHTENLDPADSTSSNHTPTGTFKAATGHELLASRMFGPVSCVLGYREGTIQLGRYGPNTASARLFWQGDEILSVANHGPNVRLFALLRAVS